MKKIFYFFTLLFITSMGLNAQNIVTNDSTLKALSLDAIHGTGEKPWGWWVNGATSKPRATLVYEHVKDRKEGATPKAAKFTAEMNGESCTWHINAAISSGSSNWVNYLDYSPFEIPLETDFFFTFWAKAETEGSTIHLGPIEIWNTGFFGGENVGWDKMPKITLTEKWTKYAVKVSADQTLEANWKRPATEAKVLDEFRIHFRSDVVLYIDDIEMFYGDELPEDVGNYYENGVEHKPGTGINDVEANSFYVYPTSEGLVIKSEGGKVEVYNLLGSRVLQENINAGSQTIKVGNNSVYIIKLTTTTGKEITRKVVVK